MIFRWPGLRPSTIEGMERSRSALENRISSWRHQSNIQDAQICGKQIRKSRAIGNGRGEVTRFTKSEKEMLSAVWSKKVPASNWRSHVLRSSIFFLENAISSATSSCSPANQEQKVVSAGKVSGWDRELF